MISQRELDWADRWFARYGEPAVFLSRLMPVIRTFISVPAGTTHWFDMGSRPDFTCIRVFTTPEGWIGNFTGSDTATRFPDFDSFAATS